MPDKIMLTKKIKMIGEDPPQVGRWNMGWDRAITRLSIDKRKIG